MKSAQFKVNQRVILKANKKEGWPEERGRIIDVENKNMCIVQLDEKYVTDPYDDGIREIEKRYLKAEKE